MNKTVGKLIVSVGILIFSENVVKALNFARTC